MIRRFSFAVALALALLAAPAWADVCSVAGQFTTGTGTAQIDVTTGTCVPKVVILKTTSNGLGTSTTYSNAIGIMTDEATDQQRVAWAGCAEVDPSDCNQQMNNAHVLLLSGGTAATECSLVLTSFNSGTPGFSVTPDDACSADTTVNYLVLGGTDITNVALHTFVLPAATGAFTVCDSGCDITVSTLTFTPDFLFLFGTNSTALNSYSPTAGFNVGFTNGTNAALYSTVAADNQATSTTSKYARGAAAQLEVFASDLVTTAVGTRVSFVNWGTTGYELNRVEGTSTNRQVFALAIKGGEWDVGDFLSQTSTGQFTETHASMTGKGVFVTHTGTPGQSTLDAATANVTHSFGVASSSTARGAAWANAGNGSTANDLYDNGLDATEVAMRFSTANPPAITQSFDFVSFTDATTMTFDQTDADVLQVFNIYFIVGESAAAAPPAIPKRNPVVTALANGIFLEGMQ